MKQYFSLIILLGSVIAFATSCKKKDIDGGSPPGEVKIKAVGLAYTGTPDVSPVVVVWKDNVPEIIPHEGFTATEPGGFIFVGDDLYVYGWEKVGYKNIPHYWKNGLRMNLSDAQYATGGYKMFHNIQVANNDVYVSGVIKKDNEPEMGCYWKNGTAIKLPIPGYEASSAGSMKVVGSDIYVAGTVYRDGGNEAYACYWKNGVLEKVFPSTGKYNNKAGYGGGIDVAGNNVYISGWSIGTNSYPYNALYWVNGKEFVPGGNKQDQYNSSAYQIWAVNNDVFVDDYQTLWQGSTGYTKHMIWKNDEEYFALGDLKTSGGINSLINKGNDLYITGWYNANKASGFSQAVYWRNKNMHALPTPSGYQSAEAYYMEVK